MFRDRLRAWGRGKRVAATPEISAAAAIACLYRHWRIAGAELERLASGITRQRFHESLRALERACASVRIADEIAELIAQLAWEQASCTSAASRLRRDLLAEILPWIEAARRELPGAASMLYVMASDMDSREAALAALRQLVRVQPPRPPRWKAGPPEP